MFSRGLLFYLNGTCGILFGVLLSVMAVICAFGAYYLDEITKEVTVVGTYICGSEVMRLCSGDLAACEDALVYGYNLDGLGIDEEDAVTITESKKFETICDSGDNDELCTQLDAGLIFQIANLASAGLGGLGLFVLLIPVTRQATCAFFIFAAVAATAAFGGFLFTLSSILMLYSFFLSPFPLLRFFIAMFCLCSGQRI